MLGCRKPSPKGFCMKFAFKFYVAAAVCFIGCNSEDQAGVGAPNDQMVQGGNTGQGGNAVGNGGSNGQGGDETTTGSVFLAQMQGEAPLDQCENGGKSSRWRRHQQQWRTGR